MHGDMTHSPVARYIERERVEREQRVLYQNLPRAVAHVADVPAVGDFITRDAGLPLLIVRDTDERVRGFYNVCRHRGTRLVSAPSGKNKKAFACPYHAWTYGLDGALQSVTHREGFVGLKTLDRGLREIELRERFGLLWIQQQGAHDIDQYLGAELCDDLDAFGFDRHVTYQSISVEKNLNWKLALDIFLEGYHVHYAHRRTIAPMFFDNVNLFDHFAPHMRSVLPKRSIESLRDKPKDDWRLRDHANVLYLIFPNTLILMQPDHASVFHIYPAGMSRCRIDAYTLLPEPPSNDKARGYWDKNVAILREAIAEDFALGESIQANLESGANEALLFGRFEQSLSWFHEDVEAVTRQICAR